MQRQTQQDFIAQLQKQAQLQARLSTSRILPRQVDWVTTLIGNYPWQSLSVLATISTLLMILSGRI